MQRTALIGHTGFVGSHVAARHDFDDLYNTSNIDQIAGREYDLVVSAAGRADSHRINEAADEDRGELEAYADILESARIGKLVHVSTVCVYDDTDRCDEGTVSPAENLTPYGLNRRDLETRLMKSFETLSLRLPQLFGNGIKKGLIYDLVNDHRVEFIRPDGVFQYYDLTRLWDDIGSALDAGLSTVNLATPPVEHRQLARIVFGVDLDQTFSGDPEPPFSAMYTRNMITRHADAFGASGDYLTSSVDVMNAIRSFAEGSST